jgi:2'-5' RNA ligase
MAKHRLGVALLIPPPFDGEIDGLRRALGDPALDRLPAHLTLVPPVNVREDRMGDALGVLREAAESLDGPLNLILGPVVTFHPLTPVLYLEVGGQVDEVHRLRNAVFRPPLARELTWDFVPHVTVADEATPERIAAAVEALADFRVEVELTHLTILEEQPGRIWVPIADARLGPRAITGRGGVPVHIDVSTWPDPDAAKAFGEPTTVTARRDGEVVGVASGRGTTIESIETKQGHEDVEAHLRRVFKNLE